MAVSALTDKFLEVLRKSALVEPARLESYLGQFSRVPEQPHVLAARMVRDGLLTHFQVQQLLTGKHKGFLISHKYKLLEVLGIGGMGKVFLCEHIVMRRLVALKVLPPEQTKAAGGVERFHREARAAGALDHPNLVHAYDVDRDDKGLHFLVMEYVDGVSLHAIIKEHGPLSPVRAAHYVAQAAAGLQHAHEGGWVHRDIKPGNLLLDRNGTIKILDMGLARFFHDQDAITKKYEQHTVLGTIDFLAPEQAIDSHTVDIRADLYSLGATFYFLLTGQSPFSGTTAEKLVRHQMREPTPIRALQPEVPAELEAVVARMMAKDPAQRYQVPAEVVEALEPWTAEPLGRPPESEMPKRSAAVASLCSPSSSGQGPPSSSSGMATSKSRITKKQVPVVPVTMPVRLTATVRGHPLLALGVAAAALVFLGSGLWFLFTGGEKGKPNLSVAQLPSSLPPPAPEPRASTPSAPPTSVPLPSAPAAGGDRLFVTRDPQLREGKTNVHDTLQDALLQAKPGNRIMVLDGSLTEQLSFEDGQIPRGVAIESGLPDGQRVVWQAPKDGPGNAPLLRLGPAEDFSLRGFTFDGSDRLDTLVTLTGRCPGVRLEGCEFLRWRRRAVSLSQCSGDKDRPVTFAQVRLFTEWGSKRTGIVFESPAKSDEANQFLTIRDSRFEGTFDAVVQITAPALDVEFVRNRIWTTKDTESPWVSDGIVYKRTATPHAMRLTFANNTLSRLANCLRFESLPPADDSRVVIRNNLIIGATSLVWVDGPTPDEARIRQWFPNFAGNVTRPPGAAYCNKGLFTTQLTRMTIPFLVLNQTDDHNFLRYKKDSPLFQAGADGQPVGVPPLD